MTDMSTNISVAPRGRYETHDQYLDRLNDALLAEARRSDRQVVASYDRPQDVPGYGYAS